MLQSFLAEFAAAWKAFVRIPLPVFLTGDGRDSDYPTVDGHPALVRVMMPLIGLVLGLFAAVPVWLGFLFPSGRLIAGIIGAALVPIFLDYADSWNGLNALSVFCDLRRQGVSLEDALSADPGSINDARTGVSLIVLMTLYLIRMIFCGVLAMCAPFWFMVSLTGAWLIRAELVTLPRAGTRSGPWLAVPRGFGKHHWYFALGAMVAAGFVHPVGVILAYAVAWAVSRLASNLCRETISGINRHAFDVFGYAGELILMLLGILLYASM
ncbi:MAG: hypothetical protein IJS14_15140 [Lentisphaeria bacterium]|nr:hypothetical protein [Lentisphaeria bacterium]